MGKIDITPSANSVTVPGDVILHIKAADAAWSALPLAFGHAPAGPYADNTWFTVRGFPLGALINLDGDGSADVTVHVSVPPDVAVGSYNVTFTAGYGGDEVGCPIVAVQVVQVRMPSLVGMTQDAAGQALGATHLHLGVVVGVQGNDSHVVSQTPAAGTIVTKDSAVDIEVAPLAIKTSEAHFINCNPFGVDVWINDRTVGGWTKSAGSPLKGNDTFDCPPVGAPIEVVKLVAGHYYELRASDTGPFSSPYDNVKWQLGDGALLGEAGAPILYVNVPRG